MGGGAPALPPEDESLSGDSVQAIDTDPSAKPSRPQTSPELPTPVRRPPNQSERENLLKKIVTQPRQQAFGRAKAKLPDQCNACPHLPLCNGGCPKQRFVKTSSGQPGLNVLCPGLITFYNHITPTLKKLARKT